MDETANTTLCKMLEAAKAEYLQKGFKSASLCNIVKTAGVTTGVFYGYYLSSFRGSEYTHTPSPLKKATCLRLFCAEKICCASSELQCELTPNCIINGWGSHYLQCFIKIKKLLSAIDKRRKVWYY